MKKEKSCQHCGRCCIICTDIRLTKEEADSGRYEMQAEHKPSKREGWSKWIIMRGAMYETELKCNIFACVYWDPRTRECLIYEDRPIVCQTYKCVDEMLSNIHQTWFGIEKGEEALCLDA